MRNRSLKISRLLLVMTILAISVSCGRTASDKRAIRAADADGDVLIGIVWPFEKRKDLFKEGVELALEEINGSGGVLGRKMIVEYADDEDDPAVGTRIAHRFCDNLDMVSVVGHFTSEVAMPASIVYQHNGMVFISAGATDPFLTLHPFPFIFSSMPSDDQFATAVAGLKRRPEFAHVERVVILSASTTDGQSFATAVSYHIAHDSSGMRVVGHHSFSPAKTNFRPLLSQVQETPCDLIILSCDEPPAGAMIKQIREMGITVPILGGNGLDSIELWKSAGKAADGTYVVSVYTPFDTDPVAVRFRQRFAAKFGKAPDAWAAQAYDAVMVLAYAMNKAKTTIPYVVRDTLLFNTAMKGATGLQDFDEHGSMTGTTVVLKRLSGSDFVFLEAMNMNDPSMRSPGTRQALSLRDSAPGLPPVPPSAISETPADTDGDLL
jgi:branched-chain amino acid transport system substrate-binding protein